MAAGLRFWPDSRLRICRGIDGTGARSIDVGDRGGTSILQRGCRGRATCRGGIRRAVRIVDAPAPDVARRSDIGVFCGDGDRRWLLVDPTADVVVGSAFRSGSRWRARFS